MEHKITGLHHVTCITAKPQEHVDFYTKVLGLRLVKLTVNFDDPTTYHTYFGDETGSPGTLMTFFPWVKARPGRIGAGQISAIAFSIPEGAMGFWMHRFRGLGVSFEPRYKKRFGEALLTLMDPDFLPIELVEAPTDTRPAGEGRYGVMSTVAIKGFHGVTASERRIESTEKVLTETLGLSKVDTEGDRTRFTALDEPGGHIDIVVRPDMPVGSQGAGTVHHVAWRTPDDEQHKELLETVAEGGYPSSGIIDRKYFHSIYFREPGGVLFEIATDPPGMTIDEPVEELGHDLLLPPQYQGHHAQIEAALPKLVLPENGKVVGAR